MASTEHVTDTRHHFLRKGLQRQREKLRNAWFNRMMGGEPTREAPDDGLAGGAYRFLSHAPALDMSLSGLRTPMDTSCVFAARVSVSCRNVPQILST